MIDVMDNSTNSAILFDNEFSDIMNTKDYAGVKSTVISVIIILNIITNSLVIAVIARYPQLREDRTTFFMFSLSVSDLAAGCTFMPISVALCSRATPEVAEMVGLLPKIHACMMWWFAFNSMHSLCWLTISKAIAILNPFKVEQLLSHKRCYFIIGVFWVIGCVLATINVTALNVITWNTEVCVYRIPNERTMKAGSMTFFVIAVKLPVSLIIYCTIRIFIVVLRTHRQISVLEQSVTVGNNAFGNNGFITVQAIRSSRNIIIICIVSLLLSTPNLAFAVLDNITKTPFPDMFSFACVWLFESNTFLNSLLYITLFKLVGQNVVHMLYAIVAYIRAR